MASINISGVGVDTSFAGMEMERGGELRRYMFAIELNGTIGTKAENGSETKSNTFTWKPDQAGSMYKKVPSYNEEFDAVRQTLVIRRLILGPSAKEGEANWVTVEVNDPDGADSKFPLCYLSKGVETQTMADLAFPDARDVTVKFTLEEGTGPVHVIGYHLIERIGFDGQEEECEEEEIDDEIDENELLADDSGTDKPKAPVIRAKRRINNGENGNANNGSPLGSAKKMKTGDGEEAMEAAAEK